LPNVDLRTEDGRQKVGWNFFVNREDWLYNPNMIYSKIKYGIQVVAVIMAIGTIFGCKKQPAAGEQQTGIIELKADSNAAKPAASKPTLNEIIRSATSWEPAFTNWYGHDAPDFAVTDLNDKKYTLGELKGKTVMLTFWATWCGPCIMEIPDLIELKKQIGDDKLVILGISYVDPRNTPERIRKFVATHPTINYPITATMAQTMPKPYNLIDGIPCSFFITPEGKIKLVTEGMIPLPQMKAIIEAER